MDSVSSIGFAVAPTSYAARDSTATGHVHAGKQQLYIVI